MSSLIAKRTQYGFQFGAALVEALASDEKKGWTYTGITTPKARIEVYVTKTGKARVYFNGLEVLTTK